MHKPPYARLVEMQQWASHYMHSRAPDVVIGENYLERWHVVPRNEDMNVYLHRFSRSDDDRALHDHPWDNTTYVLSGGYIEHKDDGEAVWRFEGSIVQRHARAAHRIELIKKQPVISLFVTGPKIREWGFHCPNGWVPWWEFCSEDGSKIGKGCGE